MHAVYIEKLKLMFICMCSIADCSGLLDLEFVLDSSGSVANSHFDVAKELVISVVNELDVRMDRTRIGLIYWSNEAFVAFNMIDYGQVKQDVVEAIRRVPFLSNVTHTAAALRLVHETAFQGRSGDRDDVPNVAIVVSDGHSNVLSDLTPFQAYTCRINDIRMVAVGFGDSINIAELSTIASRPLTHNLFTNSRPFLLENITTAIIGSTCNGTNLSLLLIIIIIGLLCS